jgi:transcriptional regulator with XRE-family HTH domain
MRQVEERIGQPLRLYLLDAYIVRERSMRQIADEIGIDVATVSRWMRGLGIPPRYYGYTGRGRVA